MSLVEKNREVKGSPDKGWTGIFFILSQKTEKITKTLRKSENRNSPGPDFRMHTESVQESDRVRDRRD